MDSKEIIKLHRGKGDMLVVGEYMNKSQKDINGKVFNNKFVIFDIIVYNSEHLVGLTYVERRKILTDIFGTKSYDDYLDPPTEWDYYRLQYETLKQKLERDINKLV